MASLEIWRKCGKNHKKCDFSNLRRNLATLKESPFFQSSICHNSRPLKLKIHKVKKQTTKIDLMVALFRVLPKLAILTIFINSQFFIQYRLFHKKITTTSSRVKRFYFDDQWFNFDFLVGQSSSLPRQTKKTEEIRQKSDKIKLNRLEI